MALTYQQLIDLAVEQYLRGMPGQADSDIEMRAEAMIPTAVEGLADNVAGDRNRAHLLISTAPVSVTAGVGTTPATALLKRIGNSTLQNTNDLTQIYSYIRNWGDYVSVSDSRLGYYNVRGTALNVTAPGQVWPDIALTATFNLTGSFSPAMPVTPNSAFTGLPTELEDDLVVILANLLRGK